MHISKICVSGFRLLVGSEIALEQQTTVVVGRNNSGKTSLAEILKRFLEEGSANFHLEDFSIESYMQFQQALEAHNQGSEDHQVRAILPTIELRVHIAYQPDEPFGALGGGFIIDLDDETTEALLVMSYQLKAGAVTDLFADQPKGEFTRQMKQAFFKMLRDRVPKLYETCIWSESPNDPSNVHTLTPVQVRTLIKTEIINAQRGLSDVTSHETDVLAGILEKLFTSASSPTADQEDQDIAAALQKAVEGVQEKIDEDFSTQLKKLLPTLQFFGYPGLQGPELLTETILDAKRLLTNHTKVRYAGFEGAPLPESYNGLGVRNLLFILLQLIGFFRSFQAESRAPGIHLIFIEEPEAHLHPQIQEVFIRQVSSLAKRLSERGDELPWPAQFVISTHSSHVANAASFKAIRYFLRSPVQGMKDVYRAVIKDLRSGLTNASPQDEDFLHQYLTLTKCDLFFADKAVLVEGPSERLLLPRMVEKLEEAEPEMPRLSSQYLSVLEVGGAYAHIFFDLLDFLELPFLVITDIDSVDDDGSKCLVHDGTGTSNHCIRSWFGGVNLAPAALLEKEEKYLVQGNRRIAFQRSEHEGSPCGRTFEDAFILANQALFQVQGATAEELAADAAERAARLKKVQFALDYSIRQLQWIPPKYILDGLRWLATLKAQMVVGDEAGTAVPVTEAPVTEV